jgi:glycerophosphoryl diester phosphodiesterase
MRNFTPEIHAHRAGPLAHGTPIHAEQTLPAFERAWSSDGVVCELDVRFTADGVPVVFHDADLQRVTGSHGRVDELDLATFRALRAHRVGVDRYLARAHRPVPLATLDEVLRLAVRGRGRLNVELKNLPAERAFDPTPRTAEKLARHLLASGVPAQRLTVQSFWEGDVAALRKLLPMVECSLLAAPGWTAERLMTALSAGADAVGLPWPATPDAIDGAHDRGLRVMTYTVNDPAAVRAAAGAGVDVVITDDPSMARRALAEAAPLAA